MFVGTLIMQGYEAINPIDMGARVAGTSALLSLLAMSTLFCQHGPRRTIMVLCTRRAEPMTGSAICKVAVMSVKIGVILPSTVILPVKSIPNAVTTVCFKSNRVQRKSGNVGVIGNRRVAKVSRLTAVAGMQTRSETTGRPMLARAAAAIAGAAWGVSSTNKVWVCCQMPA